jgi:hypothetical protein
MGIITRTIWNALAAPSRTGTDKREPKQNVVS